jgi:hypothetical protein
MLTVLKILTFVFAIAMLVASFNTIFNTEKLSGVDYFILYIFLCQVLAFLNSI